MFSVENVPGSFTLEGSSSIQSLVFNHLEAIKGAIVITGSMTNISLPTLRGVSGTLSISSTADISLLCNSLDESKLSGTFSCASNAQTSSSSTPPPLTSSSNPAPTSSSSTDDPLAQFGQDDSSDLALGAKVGIIIAALVLAAFFAVGAFFLLRARLRGKVMEIVPTKPGSPMQLPVYGSDKKIVITRLKGKTVRVVKIRVNGEEVGDGELENGSRGGEGMDKEISRGSSLRSVSSLGSTGPGAVGPVSPV